MSRRVSRVVLGVLLVAGWLAPAAQGAGAVTHAGTIVAVEPDGRALTLEEMGPWTGAATKPIRHSIVLSPETKIVAVARSEGANAAGWQGGFSESPLSASDLRPGEFATVSVETSKGHLVAQSVTVVRPTPETQ